MTRWIVAFVAACVAFLAVGCNPAMEPIAPVPVGDACTRAQSNLDTLKCEWRVNSANHTWAQSCAATAERGYPRILIVADCVAKAPTCADARAKCR